MNARTFVSEGLALADLFGIILKHDKCLRATDVVPLDCRPNPVLGYTPAEVCRNPHGIVVVLDKEELECFVLFVPERVTLNSSVKVSGLSV
jgi:hypothetical protein